MRIRTVWRGVFALLFALVTFLTLTPDPDDTKQGLAIARFLAGLLFQDERLGDKVAHFLAYASLGVSAMLAGLRLAGRRAAVIALLASYGATLEYLQGLGGVREAELADAIANSLGALAAWPIMLVLERAIARARPA